MPTEHNNTAQIANHETADQGFRAQIIITIQVFIFNMLTQQLHGQLQI
jgi:hypothetical protein